MHQSPEQPSKAKHAPTYLGPRPVPLGSFLKKKLPPAVSRVWPWLDSGESCLLWGSTGTGKSFLGMTLALGVAGGGSALGWEFRNSTKVLYVDGEQSVRDLQTRFRLLRSTLGAEHSSSLAAKNLLIESRTCADLNETFFDLSTKEHAAPFVDSLRERGVGFVVFDNLSTLSDCLQDENDATAFKPMQALFSRLKAENIASVLIHHSGKAPGGRFRGSSNIATTFERIVALRHNDSEPPTVLSACALIEKYRSKPPPGFSTEVHFTFASDEGPKGESINARWEIRKEESVLEEAWRMFRRGSYGTVGEFIEDVNTVHGTKHLTKHFARDFKVRWLLRDASRRSEIDAVMESLRERRRPREPRTDF
jgi:hypothetical protein